MFGRKSEPTKHLLRANVYETKSFSLAGTSIYDTALSMVSFLQAHPEYDFVTDGQTIVSQGDTPGDVVRNRQLLGNLTIQFNLLEKGLKNGNWTED